MKSKRVLRQEHKERQQLIIRDVEQAATVALRNAMRKHYPEGDPTETRYLLIDAGIAVAWRAYLDGLAERSRIAVIRERFLRRAEKFCEKHPRMWRLEWGGFNRG